MKVESRVNNVGEVVVELTSESTHEQTLLDLLDGKTVSPIVAGSSSNHGGTKTQVALVFHEHEKAELDYPTRAVESAYPYPDEPHTSTLGGAVAGGWVKR